MTPVTTHHPPSGVRRPLVMGLADVEDRAEERAQFTESMQAESARLRLDADEACKAAIAFISLTIHDLKTRLGYSVDDCEDLHLDCANEVMAQVGLEITAMQSLSDKYGISNAVPEEDETHE
jgi:hypothetical protein